jgi:hypothetical protein
VRPDLEAVLTSLLFCVLSPDRRCAASDEFISHLLLNAVGEGLIEGLHYGLSSLVPGAGLFLSEWEEQGILERSPFDQGLAFTSKGVEVMYAKLMSVNYLKYREGLDRINQAVLTHTMDPALSGPVAHAVLGWTRHSPGARLA